MSGDAILTRRQFLLRAVCVPALIVGSPGSHAQEAARAELRVLAPDDSPAARRVLDALRAAFPSLVVVKDCGAGECRAPDGLTLLLGPSALRAAARDPIPGVSLSIFASSEAVAASGLLGRKGFTAIYSDPAPQQQLRFVRLLYGRSVRVGVLLSPATEALKRTLQDAATQEGLVLDAERLEPGENPIRALNRLHEVSAVLAVPDGQVFNPQTLRAFIESSYRRDLPIIGYTASMVTAGALATTYADSDDVIAHLREVVAACQMGRIPEPQFPKYWRVVVNDNVARSLNLSVSEPLRQLANRPR